MMPFGPDYDRYQRVDELRKQGVPIPSDIPNSALVERSSIKRTARHDEVGALTLTYTLTIVYGKPFTISVETAKRWP